MVVTAVDGRRPREPAPGVDGRLPQTSTRFNDRTMVGLRRSEDIDQE